MWCGVMCVCSHMSQELESWNITLDTKMLAVEGKVLPAEAILFGKGVKGSYDPKTGNPISLLLSANILSSRMVCPHEEFSAYFCCASQQLGAHIRRKEYSAG